MREDWPPLILDAPQPRWIFWRDRIVTLAAWVFFLVLLEQQVQAFLQRIAEARLPQGQWEYRLLPFLNVSAALVAALLIAALFTRRRGRQGRQQPPPEPLAVETEAEQRGLSVPDLVAARQAAIVAVSIDGTGRFELKLREATPHGDPHN